MSDARMATLDVDRIGSFVAALCGVHCLVTPFVLALLPALPIGEPLEWTFFAASTLLAAFTAWRAYRRSHSWEIGRWMGAGLAVLVTPHLLGWSEARHVPMSMIGACLLITGHVRNHRGSSGPHEHVCRHRPMTASLG